MDDQIKRPRGAQKGNQNAAKPHCFTKGKRPTGRPIDPESLNQQAKKLGISRQALWLRQNSLKSS